MTILLHTQEKDKGRFGGIKLRAMLTLQSGSLQGTILGLEINYF